jgi:hypothetical protein
MASAADHVITRLKEDQIIEDSAQPSSSASSSPDKGDPGADEELKQFRSQFH